MIRFKTTRTRHSFGYNTSLFNKVSKSGPFIGFLKMSLGDPTTGNTQQYNESNTENREHKKRRKQDKNVPRIFRDKEA
jgi:hypothetical protein